MKKRIAIALVATLLGSLPALPSHAEVCEGNLCEVSFAYTGEIVQFNVPEGVTSLEFEVSGAAGGRGGLGGRVSGELSNLPQALYIVVGGEGQVGSQVAGGYNGGGRAGGYRDNEGSGGGASDIRLDLGLDSRIVVAGGGGGSGGYAGAAGGNGGGLNADPGQDGQGSGGGGGTQSSGGYPGSSNGGSAATSGSFGSGGIGGNSSNAGGGGGGGGWYGGGGGGADDNTCCSDGGGGGGGSSYTNSGYAANVTHESGVQQGAGSIVLRYARPFSVLSFSGEQVDASSAKFTIALSYLAPITLADLDTSSLTCDQLEIAELADGYEVTATGCPDGPQQLAIPAGAFGELGPEQEQLASFEFDALPPEFEWWIESVDHSGASAQIGYSLSEGELALESLTASACEQVEIQPELILLSGCAEGQSTLTLAAEVFTDAWGNAAPSAELVQEIALDFTPPTVSEVVVEVNEDEASFAINLGFSEAAELAEGSISLSGATPCEIDQLIEPDSVTVSGSCGYGEVQLSLPALALSDVAGNMGPDTELIHVFSVAEPVLPEPSPEQVEEIVTPPVVSEPVAPPQPVFSPEPVVDPIPAPEPEPEPIDQPTAEPEPTVPEADAPAGSDSDFAEEVPQQQEQPVPAPIVEPEPVEGPAATESTVESNEEPQATAPAREDLVRDDEIVEITASAEPVAIPVAQRLDTEPLVTDESAQGSWAVLLGGVAAIVATGYLALRFIGR